MTDSQQTTKPPAEGLATSPAASATELANPRLRTGEDVTVRPKASTAAEPGPFTRLEGELDRSPGDLQTSPTESSMRYINRELSWLRFNTRVLEEARDPSHPLLERVRFLSIYHTNLDEFFMVRVSGLSKQLQAGVLEAPPDGMTPAEQLESIHRYLLSELELVDEVWRKELRPQLEDHGITVTPYSNLDEGQRQRLRDHFGREIFPVLTPLAFDPSHPFPHISNLSLNLAVTVRDVVHAERFARVKVPSTIPRLVEVPTSDHAGELAQPSQASFVWLEEVIEANLDLLFPGLEIVEAHPFRVTRDADFEIEVDEASDLLTVMAEVVGQRHFGKAVRLEVERGMPEGIRDILVRNLGLRSDQVYTMPKPLGLADLSQLASLPREELSHRPFLPIVATELKQAESLWGAIRSSDILLYHPYDSFSTVVQLVRDAAADPKVLAIKQTLYRAGVNSPLVEALKEARENGKQVSVLVELKARFDEEKNISWARELEAAGVHVVYGVVGLKTHAKMCLIVRREGGGFRHYAHLSSGNYNPTTARQYTDIGMMTCDPAIGGDVSRLFNALTGYAAEEHYEKLLVAPGQLRTQILERIEREIERHARDGDGLIAMKMNSLVDRRCIDALYRASQAGVVVRLQVRGICCLRPGVEGLSENIDVTSVVGRFLEHARLYYFRNGGDEELFSGSADLMPRNLDGRVEVLFPIEDPHLREAVREDVLFLHLDDDVKARRLQADGEYVRVLGSKPDGGARSVDSQAVLLSEGGRWRR